MSGLYLHLAGNPRWKSHYRLPYWEKGTAVLSPSMQPSSSRASGKPLAKAPTRCHVHWMKNAVLQSDMGNSLSIAVPVHRLHFYYGAQDLSDSRASALRPKEHPIIVTLEKAGHRVTRIPEYSPDIHEHDVLLSMGGGPHRLPLLREIKRNRKSARPLVVVWHFDPLPPPSSTGLRWPLPSRWELARILLRRPYAFDVYTNYLYLRSLVKKRTADVLVVSTKGRVEFLAERGIPAYYVPLGYSPELGCDMGLPRDIDVLFLGDLLVPRRKRILNYLRRRGIDVSVRGDFFDPSCWGESRKRFLNRTKIFLNIPRLTGEFTGLRMALAAANKSLVVSEPMYNSAPYVAGKHYVSARVQEMPQVIAYYLAHDEERERIANEAHRFVIEEMTMERSASLLLKLIADHIHPDG